MSHLCLVVLSVGLMRGATHIAFAILWVVAGLPDNLLAQHGCANFGDPIINITFGNAADPMTRLADGVSDYLFYQGGGQFMMPNFYTITSRAGTAGRSVFHDLSDHTGDVGGGMLLVNADYQPGVFYQETQYGLCPNTDFTFSAWVVNASPPDLQCGSDNTVWTPNVQFEIRTLSGQLIDSVPTGEISASFSPQWRRYELSFNTGNHSDVVLVMRNIGPGGCGNNLAIDDIQFRPCGPQLNLLSSLQIMADQTVFLCADAATVSFDSQVGAGYDFPVYQWQQRNDDSETWYDMDEADQPSLTVSPRSSTWYRLAVASNAVSLGNPKCRVVSDPVRVAHLQVPDAGPVPARLSYCLDDGVSLGPGEFVWVDSGPLTYQWYNRDGDGWAPVAGADGVGYVPTVTEAGSYRYLRQATNICGMVFPTDEFELNVLPMTETALNLPKDLFCLDGTGVRLSGGTPDTFGGHAGIYHGRGVEDGVFYPSRAGVGQHVITYSPPSGIDCPSPSAVTVTVLEPLYLHPMSDHVVLRGNRIRLLPETNAAHFAWDPGSPGLSDYTNVAPLASPASTTTYRLTVADRAGCELTGEVTVRVLEPLAIPNSFTPNGDGINDLWEIEGLNLFPNAVVQVFNRWGASVFSSYGYASPWDGQFRGTPLPSATYYYMISSDVLQRPLSGAVTILR